jgi:hypothetical protein
MERLRMVKLADLHQPNFNVIIELSNVVVHPIEQMVKKYGQYKPLVVCQVEGKLMIIDGSKLAMILHNLKYEEVLVFDLGVLDLQSYTIIRIMLNNPSRRTDYLGIAEALQHVCENEVDAKRISNATGFSVTDVKRYKDLIKFNWDEFLAKKIEPNQLALFDLYSR